MKKKKEVKRYLSVAHHKLESPSVERCSDAHPSEVFSETVERQSWNLLLPPSAACKSLSLPAVAILALRNDSRATLSCRKCCMHSPPPPCLMEIALGCDTACYTLGRVKDSEKRGTAYQRRRLMGMHNVSADSCLELFKSTSGLFSRSSLLTRTADTSVPVLEG